MLKDNIFQTTFWHNNHLEKLDPYECFIFLVNVRTRKDIALCGVSDNITKGWQNSCKKWTAIAQNNNINPLVFSFENNIG